MPMPTLSATLRLDGATNLTGATALAILAPTLTAPAGMVATWPLWLLAGGLAAYGLENEVVARRPRRRTVIALIVADAAFAVALLTVALANPTDAVLWLRWALFAVADLALIAATLKTYGLSRHAEGFDLALRQPA